MDISERPKCGPVKLAWAEAEAMTCASLVDIKNGKMNDLDDPVDLDVRIGNTTSFVEYYHIKLPAHLNGCDTLVGRLVREHARKLPSPIDIRKVKSLAFLGRKGQDEVTISIPVGSGASSVGHMPATTTVTAEDEPLTIHTFIYKHRVLVNSYAWAVAPD